MDSVSDPRVSEVVVMSGSQLGKTELLLNIVGFHIAHDPAPILVVQPTLEMASAWSKDRLANMLRDSPCLRDKVADPRSSRLRKYDFTQSFPGRSYHDRRIEFSGINGEPTDPDRLGR
jgi:phage terminase large subunit GpA-like protein